MLKKKCIIENTEIILEYKKQTKQQTEKNWQELMKTAWHLLQQCSDTVEGNRKK